MHSNKHQRSTSRPNECVVNLLGQRHASPSPHSFLNRKLRWFGATKRPVLHLAARLVDYDNLLPRVDHGTHTQGIDMPMGSTNRSLRDKLLEAKLHNLASVVCSHVYLGLLYCTDRPFVSLPSQRVRYDTNQPHHRTSTSLVPY